MLLSEWIQSQVDIVSAKQEALYKATLPLNEMVENINDRMAALQQAIAVCLTVQLLIAEHLEARGEGIEARTR